MTCKKEKKKRPTSTQADNKALYNASLVSVLISFSITHYYYSFTVVSYIKPHQTGNISQKMLGI